MDIFQWKISKPEVIASMIKTLEALTSHSDTALFKVRPKCIYILITDSESKCCMEARFITSKQELKCSNDPNFTFSCRIMLDSLVNELKKIDKSKNTCTLFSSMAHRHTLQLKEQNNINNILHHYVIESAEHRSRVFHIISTRSFKKSDYAHIKYPVAEFNKTITAQCIASGVNGKIGIITVVPNGNECDIQFENGNHGGLSWYSRIHTFKGSEDVPCEKLPENKIVSYYLPTYLKRSQNIMSNFSDYVSLFISKDGLMIQTSVKHNHCVIVFSASVEDIDEDSYV